MRPVFSYLTMPHYFALIPAPQTRQYLTPTIGRELACAMSSSVSRTRELCGKGRGAYSSVSSQLTCPETRYLTPSPAGWHRAFAEPHHSGDTLRLGPNTLHVPRAQSHGHVTDLDAVTPWCDETGFLEVSCAGRLMTLAHENARVNSSFVTPRCTCHTLQSSVMPSAARHNPSKTTSIHITGRHANAIYSRLGLA